MYEGMHIKINETVIKFLKPTGIKVGVTLSIFILTFFFHRIHSIRYSSSMLLRNAYKILFPHISLYEIFDSFTQLSDGTYLFLFATIFIPIGIIYWYLLSCLINSIYENLIGRK